MPVGPVGQVTGLSEGSEPYPVRIVARSRSSRADHVRRDGSVLPVHVETVVEHDGDGRARRRIGYLDDLTAERAQDRTRHAVRERLRTAFADAPVGMAVLEDDYPVSAGGGAGSGRPR